MPLPYVRKTGRSTKLGAYGEHFLAHWLTRGGFHTSIVDGEGIDILAVRDDLRIGISMKTRFYPKFDKAGIIKNSDAINRIRKVCTIWNVEPWVAVYSESADEGLLVALPLDHYIAKYVVMSHKYHMLGIRPDALSSMISDPKCHIVKFRFTGEWFSQLDSSTVPQDNSQSEMVRGLSEDNMNIHATVDEERPDGASSEIDERAMPHDLSDGAKAQLEDIKTRNPRLYEKIMRWD